VARVVIERLTKIFDRAGGEPIPALKEVKLTIEDKELMVLVGPSGCGKTTLLRANRRQHLDWRQVDEKCSPR
jgi:ABC-type sugar transport system ATPase subunit